ncbi:hypothetical protein cyc_07331 [Cyclospora cayetanensis]|uniref:Uncharacterized protein n=1 Tax=Cyclospora cayetanensis TaxID=88456 RepID=A0A1D3D627_9EIME|nr:hypothetical protein cyc_07331 [Cyclospora cayetanensis]
MSNPWAHLFLALALHWVLLVSPVALGAVLDDHAAQATPSPHVSGPLSSILAATEGLQLHSGSREPLSSILEFRATAQDAHTVGTLVGALEKGVSVTKEDATVLDTSGSSQRHADNSTAWGTPSIICILFASIVISVCVAIGCVFVVRRTKKLKAAKTISAEEVAHSASTYLIGRWGWTPAASKRSSTNIINSSSRRCTPRVYPSSAETEEPLSLPPITGLWGPSIGISLMTSRLEGEVPWSLEAPPSAAQGPPKGPQLIQGSQTQQETISSALKGGMDSENADGCVESLSWQPTHLQHQVLCGGPSRSSSRDSLGGQSPSGLSKAPYSCRTSASAAAAAAIELPTTFAVATPCSGGLKELLQWGAGPGAEGEDPEEADLSVFASLPGELPNAQSF